MYTKRVRSYPCRIAKNVPHTFLVESCPMYDIFITGERETSCPVPSVQCARSRVGRVNACLATGEKFNQVYSLMILTSPFASHTYV